MYGGGYAPLGTVGRRVCTTGYGREAGIPQGVKTGIPQGVKDGYTTFNTFSQEWAAQRPLSHLILTVIPGLFPGFSLRNPSKSSIKPGTESHSAQG